MAGKWRASTWGDEVSLEYGKALRGHETAQGPYRVFGSNGPIGWTAKPLAQGPGVILGRKGAYRGVEFSRDPFFVIDTAYRVVPKSELDMRWLYYAVKHYKLGEIDDGSPIPSTTTAAVYMLNLDVPPLDEQRAIAHILGTLDDKIELNRRMSETLEAMARALFKSWFVDFDPVRAKAEGRDPGLSRPLADLFPARLVDSELGEIPEGWGVAQLPEVVDVNPTRALRKGVAAPYLDMANMPTHMHSAGDVVDREFGSGMRFINGDTLVARITPCLENGKTAFVDFLQDGQVGWGSTEYIVLRPKAPLPEEYAYCLARSVEFREFAIQSMTGTSGRQRVPAESLAHFRVAVPPRSLAEAFGRAVKPRFARARAAVRESRTLAAQRDALLPKLVSGELRIRTPLWGAATRTQ
jgi:type I restriction enzyme S subunit